jgi:hypothetical protein
MNDRDAARSCKSVDRPSWRAASYAIGIDARRAETRLAWFRSQEPSWLALAVFFSVLQIGRKMAREKVHSYSGMPAARNA